jgi:hypothetical protein
MSNLAIIQILCTLVQPFKLRKHMVQIVQEAGGIALVLDAAWEFMPSRSKLAYPAPSGLGEISHNQLSAAHASHRRVSSVL